MKARLGEILVQSNIITQEQLLQALEEQKKSGTRLANVLTKLGFLKEEDALFYLSKQLGVPSVDLRNFDIEKDVIDIVPVSLIKKYHCIPLNLLGDTLTIAIVDPTDYIAIDDISFSTGFNIETVLTTESLFEQSFNRYYKKQKSADLDVFDYETESEHDEPQRKSRSVVTHEVSEEEILDLNITAMTLMD